jgi:leader peptidase (prepilin peptidase) / N-methyltransferase
MPEPLLVIVVAALGLAIGSFLNVCIYRLPKGESLAFPPSHCTTCGRPLRSYENVPVFAWVALRGRCRTCGARISVMYPVVELVAGVVAAVWFSHFGLSVLFAARLVFAFALIVLFVIDLQHRILPNVITVPGIAAGFLFSLVGPPDQPGWMASLLGLVAGGGSLFLLAEAYYRVRGEEGLGMGDVKMLAMIGAFLGWKLMLLTLVFGSFLGSLVGVAMIVTRAGGLKYALPFGTFLAVAALAASIVGDPIVQWYVAFYR